MNPTLVILDITSVVSPSLDTFNSFSTSKGTWDYNIPLNKIPDVNVKIFFMFSSLLGLSNYKRTFFKNVAINLIFFSAKN